MKHCKNCIEYHCGFQGDNLMSKNCGSKNNDLYGCQVEISLAILLRLLGFDCFEIDSICLGTAKETEHNSIILNIYGDKKTLPKIKDIDNIPEAYIIAETIKAHFEVKKTKFI